jgi:putative heme-binding domain-containing protein
VLAAQAIGYAADPFEDLIRKTDPLDPPQERLSLHLPPGFEVQLVASEPEIGKPMNMAFDAQGRLWITQSREYPFAAPLDRPGRDMIKIISDFDETGHARKVTTFAEGLNIPIGLYPYKDGVIAFSIPYIYYFQDTNGDGRSDKKELILGRFGFERDVHGLTSAFRRGFDGWIYADHGFNNDTTLTAADGSTIKMNSGNCYRFKIDGSHVEQYSHGQVNPFGLMFDPLGDLWSADCHSSPVYQLLRGAYYPSFGKPHDGLGFGPDICDHSHGSTAIAGMVFYAADNFPAEYRGNTFIGNVMTCRINRDSLIEHGSTRVAHEEKDFLSSDDPWFRPVDLQLGPDGAIYVADFYNRIIGHYEVALDHPGRDRERGRIWRIVYKGDKAAQSAGAGDVLQGFNLARASIADLIKELASANITRRMLAMNQLVDRIGEPAIKPTEAIIRDSGSTAFQRAHGLWVLHRLGGLNEATLLAAAKDPDRTVRVHAMRVLSETPAWSPAQNNLALAGLNDPDSYVQRDAADALGRHPAFAHIQPLLEASRRVPKEDGQRLHVIRMALRDQLAADGNLARIKEIPLSEQDTAPVADLALGIPSSDAGAFLAGELEHFADDRTKVASYLRHAARYAPAELTPRLASFTRTRFSNDLDFQLSLLKSIQDGANQRGTGLDPMMRDWGRVLADQLLGSANRDELDWRNSPLKGFDTTNPWNLEKRASSDQDRESQFICSLSPGGEKFTGILKSKPFIIPDSIRFYMAGHDGPPGKAPQKKNLIRLRDADSQEILAQSAPPRNDIAQPFTWDLSKYAGRKASIEIVDGDNGNAYAWLAVGRFNPAVVPLPLASPNQTDKRVAAAAELAASLRLHNLEAKLSALMLEEDADVDARSAAAKAVAAINAEAHMNAFSNLLLNAAEPIKLREKSAATLGDVNSSASRSLLVEAFRTAPWSLQTQIGLALAANAEGADTLLQAVEVGKASARLLQERSIRDRLAAAKPPSAAERMEKLTANLPRVSAERQKLIDQRRAAFHPDKVSASQGGAVFKQYCSVCHSLDGQGALIGPQLDGVGGRGVDRLIEDILDPSRNVDRAFRTTLFVLNDGDVQSGLFRREEGEMVVFAESTGKETSIPKKQIKERRESESSLMPDNFSEVIPEKEFDSLLAYLLEKNRVAIGSAK